MSVVVDVYGVHEGTGTHISVLVYMASDGQFDALDHLQGNQLENKITSLSKQTLIVKARVKINSFPPRTVSTSRTIVYCLESPDILQTTMHLYSGCVKTCVLTNYSYTRSG